MAMFLIAEGVFFSLLILAFVYFRAAGGGRLNFSLGAFDTGCMAMSSFTVWRGAVSERAGLWLGATILFGVLFLVGQGRQYLELIREGVTMGQGLFGTTFFTLTGVHGLHVLIGLVALAVAPSSAVRAMAMYWIFFAALWLAIFFVAYVWGAA